MTSMSTADALKEYGYVGTLANSIPELKRILLASAARKDSVEEFTRAVQDSRWWKLNADSIKQYQILKSTKPGEFKQQRDKLETHIRTLAAQMGVRSFGGDFLHLVNMAQQFGWDDTTLQQHIGAYLGTKAIQRGVSFGGQAGTIQQQVRKMFADYGIKYSGYQTGLWTRDILTGKITIENIQAHLMNQAKAKYAGLGADIDQGRTVREIADPYIQSMSQTLELPQGTLDVYDPKIQRALTNRDPKSGSPTVTPLWQFEMDLKNDPRWDTTKNAVNSAYDQAAQIGRDLGFLST